jgi:hypothetical protein
MKKIGLRGALIAGFALMAAACTSLEPYHRVYEVCDSATGQNCQSAVMERDHGNLVGFVEFDDQGWQWDRGQTRFIAETLQAEAERQRRGDSKKHGFLLFVHAHGWRHNAQSCDRDVACFRRMLQFFADMEGQAKKPRQVVGIYVGWRGLSTTGPALWEVVSFWDRKNTAERVGTGALVELLSRLKEFRDKRPPTERTHLIVSGHSFGGQVMHRAISQMMIAGAIGDRSKPARGVADLVVIVNPAYEASQYYPLFDVATNRCYPATQKPVLLTVTSSADLATGMAFPLGRSVSTLMETYQGPRQSRSDRTAVGHFPPFHTAVLRGPKRIESPPEQSNDCNCPFLEQLPSARRLEALETHRAAQLARKAHAQMITRPGASAEAEPPPQTYGIATLHPRAEYAPNFPYQMIYTDDTVIPSHNDVFSTPFVDFLRHYYIANVYVPDVIPALMKDAPAVCYRTGANDESSCQRDGKPCFELDPPPPR